MEQDNRLEYWSGIHLILNTICDKYDTVWRKRNRILDTRFMVLFILKLVLSKNKNGYNSTLAQLWSDYYGNERQAPQQVSVSASSICEARQKFPELIFKELSESLISYRDSKSVGSTWHGCKLYAVDGSQINLPRELLSSGYKLQDEKRRYYPQGLMSCLYNLGDKFIYDFSLTADGDERSCALDHMNYVDKGDIMIFDRGYFSYLLLHQGPQSGGRCKQR